MRLDRLFIAGALLLSIAAPVAADTYPSRPIKIVVGYTVGGGADTYARLIGEKMSPLLGQPMVIENRPGANATVGAAFVAKAPADGYTLLFVANTHVSNGDLYANLPFKPIDDFVPIGISVASPMVLVSAPSFPPKSVADLISLAKQSPGKVTLAAPGIGSPSHLTMEMFKSRSGTDIQVIQYTGGGAAGNDVLGGHVNLQISTPIQAIPHLKAGKLKALAQTGLKRSDQIPDVPTIAESGLPGFESLIWFGMLAPANVPEPVVARLNEAMNKVLHDPEMVARLRVLGTDPVGGTVDYARQVMRDDQQKWQRIIQAVGIKGE
ncbi:MAG: Bug family tripartite tricarboxylate transporter substrate binding protein [Lautropia sp.]